MASPLQKGVFQCRMHRQRFCRRFRLRRLEYPPRRRGGACCLQREVRVEGIGGGNVGKGREITGSGREKGRGVAIVSGAAVIGDWSNRIKTVTRSEYSADIGGQRGPTEVGVKLVNSVELRLGATAFEDLFQCQMDEVAGECRSLVTLSF